MTVLDNAPGGCSPCMFVMGMFGGYIASAILNALGNASSEDDGMQAKAPASSSSTEANLTDEGNMIQSPVAKSGAINVEPNTHRLEESKGTQPTPPSNARQGTPNNNAHSEHGAVKLVIQRFRSASLALSPDETAQINQSGDLAQKTCGMLVYVSFSKAAEANRSAIFSAARTVLNLSVLTRGVWGDGSGTVSILDLATEVDKDSSQGGVPVVLVPQANLVSKVKNNGKSIQYHGQVAKSLGKDLFDTFVRSVQLIAYEHQCLARGEGVSSSLRKALIDVGGSTSDVTTGKSGGPQAIDPSVPPRNMFQDAALYESWDEDGIPTILVGGEKPSKSAVKKMKKQQLAQKKRHDKYLASGGAAKENEVAKNQEAIDDDAEDVVKKLDDGFVKVVAGTFGNLQSLSFESDMGPFCHLLKIG